MLGRQAQKCPFYRCFYDLPLRPLGSAIVPSGKIRAARSRMNVCAFPIFAVASADMYVSLGFIGVAP